MFITLIIVASFISPSRLNGEEGRQFLPVIVKHFARLSKVLLVSVAT